ncbi:hypothetical protein [Thiocapsa sp. UBA6158]|jgi:hypothetical protein|uniref:hypothetical protein n=1 Tax=Thiocapsa sp. UBA6158 TaxID=1947692 RepID=UPI0025D04542|nr:hypothetical protein [Thiocapsa sp. UBA6158]
MPTRTTAASQAALAAATQAAPPPLHPTAPTLYTVRDLARCEPALTVGGIRDDLFHRSTNGLEESGAVIRRGRRLLLHRELYMTWLLARGRSAA